MASLMDLKKQRETALDRADAIIRAAESQGRALTTAESGIVDSALAEANSLTPQIQTKEKQNSITQMFKGGRLLTDEAPSRMVGSGGERYQPRVLSRQYQSDLLSYLQSGGKKVSEGLADFGDPIGGYPLTRFDAALYEGAAGSGGYAVPIVVDDQIVPLAPQELAIRQISTVIPTRSDIKIPTKTAFGSSAAKAETSAFGGTQPTLGQFTLSAYMAGTEQQVSWELAQDVPAFQAFVVDDMILDQQMYEESLFVSGSGSGQAQGLIGNVGVGVTEEPDSNGNLVSISGTLDLIGTLNAVYHANASWLMSRATSIIIRKAQVESNLFNPVWQRQGAVDYLHGYPVSYCAYMPTAARGNAPVLFGDFKRGYIIGDRGGSGINVKVLDQPLATQGLIVLLAYRRMDARVRRSEAIQQYNISAS